MEVVVENVEMLILVYGTIMTGLVAYYAWCRPRIFQRWLEIHARFYRGWMPMTERAMKSRLNFHLLRITDTAFFVFSLTILVRKLFFASS